MADPRDVLDSLVSDACNTQRALGVIPRPQETRDELLPIVDRLVKKNADEAGRLQPAPAPKRERTSNEQIEAAYKKAGGIGANVQVTREVSPIVTPKPQTREQRLDEKRKRRRLRLLWSKPDWRLRLMNVDILACQGVRGPEAKAHAEFQYAQILEDSERVFGPYWKDRRKPIYSSGSGKRGTVQS